MASPRAEVASPQGGSGSREQDGGEEGLRYRQERGRLRAGLPGDPVRRWGGGPRAPPELPPVTALLAGRVPEAAQRRVLDRATRQRRLNRQLEALENDNFGDDPQAGLPRPGKRLPHFADTAETGEGREEPGTGGLWVMEGGWGGTPGRGGGGLGEEGESGIGGLGVMRGGLGGTGGGEEGDRGAPGDGRGL